MSSDFFNSCEVLDTTEVVDAFIKNHLKHRSREATKLSPQLLESIEYSLFSGGKRFRPALCLMVEPKAVPLAAAIEMVHTYSLIHDDLPCMDNDDERRGLPTNHKKFGEALALLAGDALLTESFFILSDSYRNEPKVAQELVGLLSSAAGLSGMVGGQAMDMNLGATLSDVAAVERVHLAKTAALIAVALEGAAVVQNSSSEIRQHLKELGLCLGLCFQIKDDLLDVEQDLSPKSYLHFLGTDKTQKALEEQTQLGLQRLSRLSPSYQSLARFFEYNRERQK